MTNPSPVAPGPVPPPPDPVAEAMAGPPPRCGDVVYHRPSGERWLVAWADPATDDLAWTGWPDGLARLSDCEIVRRCTDEQHASAVDRWRQASGGDSRRARVLRMYGTPADG